MKPELTLSLVVISLLAIVPMVGAVSTTSASSPSSGYVDYSLQVVRNGTQHAFSVTETVSPSSAAGSSIVSLAVEAASSNFTYSHVVNSSLTLFPYLPAISNQNFSYAAKSYNITAKISGQGTSSVSFHGATYTLSNYALSVDITSVNGSKSVTGTVSAFPSDLVYSFGASFNGTQVSGQLTGTSLPLTSSSAGPAVQAASAGLGLSLAGAAVVLSLGVRAKRKKSPAETSKPDHWVD
ncbi:MAG: hypothetical protein OK454_07660 [Thaumarchaeota archaeon]|nr:hypothetical protein [Nitrososphaerota archaeon]